MLQETLPAKDFRKISQIKITHIWPFCYHLKWGGIYLYSGVFSFFFFSLLFCFPRNIQIIFGMGWVIYHIKSPSVGIRTKFKNSKIGPVSKKLLWRFWVLVFFVLVTRSINALYKENLVFFRLLGWKTQILYKEHWVWVFHSALIWQKKLSEAFWEFNIK